MITVLAGGTGSVKLVRGITSLTETSVICNVGDNIWLHGLYICPDIDTLVYGLANILDTERGWGIKHDTFEFLGQLERLGTDAWFKIGDRDLAMHMARTKMLRDGHGLLDITRRLCSRLGIGASVIPASEDHAETLVDTDHGRMHLQEFWVKHGARPRVKEVIYSGAGRARPTTDALGAIRSSNTVIVAPANPVSSIGPILAIKGMREALRKTRNKCMAVSPIIGNKPVSGPAAKYMRAMGLEVSPYGVASYYSDFISTFIMHTTDKQYAGRVEDLGVKANFANIIMDDGNAEARLASYLLGLQKSVRH